MVTIRKYEELTQYVEMFATGKAELMILHGVAGLGKTEQVVRKLKEVNAKHKVIDGYLTKTQLIRVLYEHRDDLIVLDDTDNLLQDKSIYGVMRAAFDTGGKRMVSYRSPSPYVADLQETFEITSNLMIITNGMANSPAISAFKSRAICIDFKPTTKEITTKLRAIAHVATKIFPKDEEVLDMFEKLAPISKQPNFRAYLLSAKVKAEGIDWQKHLAEAMVVDPLLSAMIQATESGKNFKSRAAKFEELTGKGARTYSRLLNEYREAMG
jgi:hypothetical protein